MTLPDSEAEIRQLSLRTLQGANFWSRRPVTRVDLVVGAFDEISSADVPGFTEALVGALPGLWEHRCSIGERGGFVTRLRRGTYAPHIMEHVALELQSLAGHEVGYGRARGGDHPGEYTVAFEHLHAGVGKRAAELALDMARAAFAGRLGEIDTAVAELMALAELPDAGKPSAHVCCGITGGALRAETQRAMLRESAADEPTVVDIAPMSLLEVGLPYATSDTAIILDAHLTKVPERYQEAEMAERLVTVVADAVPPGGIVVVPAREQGIRSRLLDGGWQVALFTTDDEISPSDARLARATASAAGGRITLEGHDGVGHVDLLRSDVPPAAQAAAALARFCLRAT